MLAVVQTVSLGRLRRMIFGAKTEKACKILPAAIAAILSGPAKPKAKGHGRNGAKDYPAAQRVRVPHPQLKAGDLCPKCLKAKPYLFTTPARLVRTGFFITSIISKTGQRRIALFFTGQKHAGENLNQLLQRRTTGLEQPMQMCDALSRNEPKEFHTLLCHCLLHGRRQFVDVVENFPEECRKVIESLREVYRFDAVTKEQKLSDLDRQAFHQTIRRGPSPGQIEPTKSRRHADFAATQADRSKTTIFKTHGMGTGTKWCLLAQFRVCAKFAVGNR